MKKIEIKSMAYYATKLGSGKAEVLHDAMIEYNQAVDEMLEAEKQNEEARIWHLKRWEEAIHAAAHLLKIKLDYQFYD